MIRQISQVIENKPGAIQEFELPADAVPIGIVNYKPRGVNFRILFITESEEMAMRRFMTMDEQTEIEDIALADLQIIEQVPGFYDNCFSVFEVRCSKFLWANKPKPSYSYIEEENQLHQLHKDE